MGQHISSNHSPTTWVLRGAYKTHNPNPEQPIKFQYKTRRKHPTETTTTNTTSSSSSSVSSRSTFCTSEMKNSKHRQRKTTTTSSVGYNIQDINQFLSKASLEDPANIPVVLSFSTVLYQTRVGGYQAELAIPLGMVVNAVFRNQRWLYVQTPHGEEGYIAYADCIPLGIIPPRRDVDAHSPCWETSADVFPRPSGNLTDSEKLSSTRSECSTRRCRRSKKTRKHHHHHQQHQKQQQSASICGERSVDRLYLRAAGSFNSKAPSKRATQRDTLLVVAENYAATSDEKHALSVCKGDVVILLSAQLPGWFWVRRKDGDEGFIPACIAGHGFL